MTDLGGPPPGWYPDPWVPAGLRWWDGRDWTPHAAPMAPPGPPFDPERSRSAAVLARWAMLAQAVATSVMALAAYPVLRSAFDGFAETFDDATRDPGVGPGPWMPGWWWALNLLSLVGLAVLAALMFWTHRATTDARTLGRPTRHEPGMATAGWVIPILNLWFPYQVVADLADDDRGAQVGWWWATYLLNGLLIWASVLVGLATGSGVAAALTAIVPIAVAWTAALLGGSLVLHVSERQRAQAASTDPADATRT